MLDPLGEMQGGSPRGWSGVCRGDGRRETLEGARADPRGQLAVEKVLAFTLCGVHRRVLSPG